MNHVDGVVTAVPTANKAKYIEHAKLAASVFKEYGALRVVECWEEDVPDGEITSFPKAVKRKDDESIVFSWIVWASKEASAAGMEKAMQDPRMDMEKNPMPFDGMRMIFGGFNMILDL